MKKFISILSLILVLLSFNAPTAKAGILVATYGSLVTLTAAPPQGYYPTQGLEIFLGGAMVAGGLALTVAGVMDAFGTGHLKSAAIILDSKAGSYELETILSDKFPQIDDAYALRSLSDAVIDARDNQEGIVHNDNVFETLVSREKVLQALEPTTLSSVEISKVAKFLSEPIK